MGISLSWRRLLDRSKRLLRLPSARSNFFCSEAISAKVMPIQRVKANFCNNNSQRRSNRLRDCKRSLNTYPSKRSTADKYPTKMASIPSDSCNLCRISSWKQPSKWPVSKSESTSFRLISLSKTLRLRSFFRTSTILWSQGSRTGAQKTRIWRSKRKWLRSFWSKTTNWPSWAHKANRSGAHLP